MRDGLSKYKTFIILGVVLVFWTLFFLFVDPQALVEQIGVENTYLVTFFLAVFGGLSTLTGSSFFVAVATFASSGANHILLGVVGGLGIFISDTVFFFIARYGVRTFEEETKKASSWLADRLERLPGWGVLLAVYLYLGFTPLPNDILMIALAFYGISYKRFAPVLLAGSITVVTLAAYLGSTLLGAL